MFTNSSLPNASNGTCITSPYSWGRDSHRPDWQSTLIERMEGVDVTQLNPRRPYEFIGKEESETQINLGGRPPPVGRGNTLLVP